MSSQSSSFSLPGRTIRSGVTIGGLFFPLATTVAPPRRPQHGGTCLHSYRGKIPAISSFVNSHRFVPTHAPIDTRSQQLIPLIYNFCKLDYKIRPTWDSNPRTKSGTRYKVCSIRGYLVDNRGDRLISWPHHLAVFATCISFS